MILLAIDPGSRSPGAAVFRFDQVVVEPGFSRPNTGWMLAATRVRVSDVEREGAGKRADRAARLIANWFLAFGAGPPDVVAYEWPQVYTRDKSMGDPNALVGLTAVAGGVAAYVHAQDVVVYKPAEWIGQVPKTLPAREGAKRKRRTPTLAESWDTPRAKLIKRCLSPAEFAICEGANHDAIDAIGIGCKFLGRFDALRVFSGASLG